MQTFTTIQDVIDQHVAPSLGEWAADFDMQAIAQAITYWHDAADEDGVEHLTQQGFRIDQDADFWAIAAEHPTN